MIEICFLYLITSITLCLGCLSPTMKLEGSKHFKFNIIFCLIIVLFVAFRDGSLMPDYDTYVYEYYNSYRTSFEISFKIIKAILGLINAPSILLFLTYAILSVTIKYYGIIKYSQLPWFSLAVWFSSILILHDMIQIRAAVASGLILFLIPAIYHKQYVKAIIILAIAFLFHRSALVAIILFVFNTKKDYWYFWVGMYLFFTIASILQINFIDMLGINDMLKQYSIVEGESLNMNVMDERPNMFAPLTLIQTITCFSILFSIKRIQVFYPLARLWLKVGFSSLIIYGMGIYVVSVRLSELLAVCYIMLIPLLYYCFKGQYAKLIGKTIICLFVLGYLTNYIFLREFIAI